MRQSRVTRRRGCGCGLRGDLVNDLEARTQRSGIRRSSERQVHALVVACELDAESTGPIPNRNRMNLCIRARALLRIDERQRLLRSRLWNHAVGDDHHRPRAGRSSL